MTYKVKAPFRTIQNRHAGQILIMTYGKHNEKTLTFSPLAAGRDSNMKCDACGFSIMNATNFGNTVHFCPDRVIEVTVTDYKAVCTDSRTEA